MTEIDDIQTRLDDALALNIELFEKVQKLEKREHDKQNDPRRSGLRLELAQDGRLGRNKRCRYELKYACMNSEQFQLFGEIAEDGTVWARYVDSRKQFKTHIALVHHVGGCTQSCTLEGEGVLRDIKSHTDALEGARLRLNEARDDYRADKGAPWRQQDFYAAERTYMALKHTIPDPNALRVAARY